MENSMKKQLANRVISALLVLVLTVTLSLPLLQTARAAADFKYIALGDSISSGYGVNKGQGYAELLSGALAQESGYKGIKLTNLSVSGDDSADMLEVISANSATIKGARLITISIGGNNFLGALMDSLVQFAMQKYSGVTDISSIKITDELISELAAYMASPTVTKAAEAGIATLPDDIDAAVKELKALAPDAKIYFALVYNPVSEQDSELFTAVDKYIKLVNGHINDRASSGYTVVDVYKAYRDYDGKGLSNVDVANFGFDPHPNAAGHLLIAARHYTAITGKPSSNAKFSTTTSATALTRAEAVSGIVEAVYSNYLTSISVILSSASTPSAFSDVDSSHRYYAQIMSAKAIGLISGVGNSKFNPDAAMTRQDYAVLLSRLFDFLIENKLVTKDRVPVSQTKPGDTGDISSYAYSAVIKFAGTPLLPLKDGKSDPKGTVTTSEISALKSTLKNLQ